MIPQTFISAPEINLNKELNSAYLFQKTNYLTQLHFSRKKPTILNILNPILSHYISDETLTVQKLTRLAGMSRTDLHRKLSRTAGMSTTEYIRHFRLNKAAEILLQHPEWNIYQVALEVGFGNQSYFTKKFKEIFGTCPTAWRKSKKTFGTYVKTIGT